MKLDLFYKDLSNISITSTDDAFDTTYTLRFLIYSYETSITDGY